MATEPSPRGAAIDVMIPAIEKDLGTLPHVIDAVRKYVRHPIGRIMVVAPDRPRIRGLCRRKHVEFVDERRALPIGKADIRYRSARWERSGWLYQQLLKLNGDTICSRDFLVVDADTVFIRPHRFRSRGRTVFYCRRWSQPEYFRMYRRLLGRRPAAPRSLVTHYMLFERSKLYKLKRAIEARHGRPWYRAVIDRVDTTKQFGFSEYETYGNFAFAGNPGGYLLRPARNKALHRHPAGLGERTRNALSARYRSLSFHKRAVYKRGVRSGAQ